MTSFSLPTQHVPLPARSPSPCTAAPRLASLFALGALAALALGGRPAAAADVGVTVSVSQPGVYGRVDIGRFPQPQLVVRQPIIVQQPVVVQQPVQPVYMWVPPGHRKKWDKHCAKYRACGVPVYFVDDRWYHEHVQPARRAVAPAPRAAVPMHPVVEGHRHGDDGHGHGGKEKKDKHDKHPKHDKHDKHEKHEGHGKKDR